MYLDDLELEAVQVELYANGVSGPTIPRDCTSWLATSCGLSLDHHDKFQAEPRAPPAKTRH
jgi:hypothetical protein